MCDECGMGFSAFDELIEHYENYHPKTIGTAHT